MDTPVSRPRPTPPPPDQRPAAARDRCRRARPGPRAWARGDHRAGDRRSDGRHPGSAVPALPRQGDDLAGRVRLGAPGARGRHWRLPSRRRRPRWRNSRRCSSRTSPSSPRTRSPADHVPRTAVPRRLAGAGRNAGRWSSPYRKRLTRLFTQAKAAGELPPELDAALAPVLFLGRFRGWSCSRRSSATKQAWADGHANCCRCCCTAITEGDRNHETADEPPGGVDRGRHCRPAPGGRADRPPEAARIDPRHRRPGRTGHAGGEHLRHRHRRSPPQLCAGTHRGEPRIAGAGRPGRRRQGGTAARRTRSGRSRRPRRQRPDRRRTRRQCRRAAEAQLAEARSRAQVAAAAARRSADFAPKASSARRRPTPKATKRRPRRRPSTRRSRNWPPRSATAIARRPTSRASASCAHRHDW